MTARRLTLAGIAVAAILLALALILGIGRADETDPPPGTTTTTVPRSASELAAGLELTDTGEVRLYVPSCPGTVVTDVKWIGFPDMGTEFWAIRLDGDLDATPTMFRVGDQPSGYETDVELETPAIELLEQDRDRLLILLREDVDGASRAAAGTTTRLDELREGMIRFDADGPAPPKYVATVEEYEAAVDCA
jgi:hypothetical protein